MTDGSAYGNEGIRQGSPEEWDRPGAFLFSIDIRCSSGGVDMSVISSRMDWDWVIKGDHVYDTRRERRSRLLRKRHMARVFRMLVPLADRQAVKLTASVEKGCTILSFEDDAYQILFNLVENGIKYNRENGSVHVRVRQEDDTVVIDVEDTGSGIPENALESIFNRFYRVDKARSRQAGGAGLGLSIVHEMVGRNFGTISVRSTVGEGSCFTVTFPSFGSGEEGDPDA